MLRINRLARFNVPRQLVTRNLSQKTRTRIHVGNTLVYNSEALTLYEKCSNFCTVAGFCIGGGYGTKLCINEFRDSRNATYFLLIPMVGGIFAVTGAMVGYCIVPMGPIFLYFYAISDL